MDSWLWDPPIDEDNFSPGEDWQPDFCFWHEPDPIENDAANEQACIQVLRILIKNADTEINELEEDIILLQCQLALTDETLSESWSNALREKIKFLEMSLKRLKNENTQKQDQQEVDDQLQVNGEPAEKIHEILKRLLENQYSLHKDEQNEGSDVESNETSMDKTKLIYSVAAVPGAKTSRQTATPSCSNARKGEDSQQTIAVLRNVSGIISRHGADSNIGIWGRSNSEEISAGVEMPSFTKTECATLNSLPKSTDPTLAKQHKLADKTTDSRPDAVEQEQLPSTSAMKPPLGTQGKLGTRSPLEWTKNDEWPYGERSKSASLWEMLEQMQKTAVTVPEKSAPNSLLRYELEQNPVSKSETQPTQKLGLAAEKELKPSPVTDRHASKTSENRKSVMETYLDIMRNRSLYAAPNPSMTLGAQSEKWKNSSVPPLIKDYKESRYIQTTSEGQKDVAQRVIQKDHRIRSRHRENEAMVDKHVKSLSGSTSVDCEPEQILESLPKETLRNLAKNKNLKGYYKLRKSELVKLLMEEVKDGDLREAYPYLFV